MSKNGLQRLNSENWDIHVLVTTILFFVLRPSMPLFKYPFVAFFLFLIIRFIYLIFKKHLELPRLKDLSVFVSVVVVYLFIIAAYFLSEKQYFLILKEIISTFIIFIFYLLLILVIKCRKDLDVFVTSFLKMTLYFAGLISVTIILDLFGVIPYKSYFMIQLAEGESLPYDYNFGIVPVILSVIIILYYLIKFDYSLKAKIWLSILAAIFTFTTLISGSTRGLLVIFALNVSIIVYLCLPLSLLKNNTIKGKISLTFYLTTNLLMVLLICFLVAMGGFMVKNRFLGFIGTKDIIETKEKLSNNLYKQYSIIGKSYDFIEFHRLIWSIRFDPLDPDKGWAGIGFHKTISSLSGHGIDIVPKDAKGCLLDKNCRLQTWDGDSYSITQIGQLPCDTTDNINTSIFCYVSPDFNGDWVKLILLYSQKKQINREYDLNRKGTWQKLEISDRCNNEPADAEFYFAKLGVTDFGSLTGYVIIAYPEFTKTSKNGNINSFYKLSYSDHRKKYVNENFKSYFLNSGKLDLLKLQKAGFFSINEFSNLYLIQDPIKKWMTNIFTEDTTYIGLKQEKADLQFNSYINDNRIERWKFAMYIYIREYSFKQKVFGGGFTHLNWYGKYFLNDKLKIDWPHNPFLSILLYSGIIGLISYLFFLYKAFQNYFNYRKEYPIFFIFFLVAFFFSFFSGGSPFDPPIMAFFVIFPFFIKHIYDKESKILENK